MSERQTTTYALWLAEQFEKNRERLPATIDAVEALAADVFRNGSEIGSTAETLAWAVDGLLVELRHLRAHRAAALSDEEREALRFCVENVWDDAEGRHPALVVLARKALARLTGGAP